MDTTHKVEYNVRNLATRAVTLFPSHAQVFRDIPGVALQPGTNEITIFGLTPTVDEDSIKVEGSGSAIIADIAVESLPNRDIFEEIYPDSDDDDASDQESDEEEPDHPPSAELKAAWAERQQYQDQLNEADELVQSAGRRKTALDDYASTLSCQHGIDLEETIESYKSAREGVAADAMAGHKRQREARELLQEANKEVARLEKLHRKEKAKVTKEWKKSVLVKTKAKIKEARREEDRVAEKERIQKERKKFWPKYCYAVKISLEANNFTPSSSRRGSMSSDIEMVGERGATPTEAQGTCNLLLSYVTTSAYWSPSYDLQLSTTGENGTLCFDAQLNNTTSETWDKTKITLSTSQTTSSGLEDVAPSLVPWRLTLRKADHPDDSTALLSSQEKSHKAKVQAWAHQKRPVGKNRAAMFGVETGPNHLQDYQSQLQILNSKRRLQAHQKLGHPGGSNQNEYAPILPPLPPSAPQNNSATAAFGQTRAGGLFGASRQANTASSLFGAGPPQAANATYLPPINPQQHPETSSARRKSMVTQQQQQQQYQQQYQQQQQQQPQHQQQMQSSNPFMAADLEFNADAADSSAAFYDEEEKEALDFQESLVEESGFTTTYEIPGQKTLAPKSNTSKQRIARINFNNVVFSHAIVAKYKAVAHLSAKLQNMSKLTLLKGPVGVTLDGSFMGRTTLPRCGAGGESFRLSLGVDPAIRVVYAPPEVRRATTGYFSHEEIKIYTRTIRIENSRTSASKHTKLLVRDQVPISSVEKLRVELLKPEGLVPDGEQKEAGEAGRAKDKDDWGTAKASLQKNGEVNWLVALRAGKSVKLGMEYLVGTPIGDHAVQAN